MQLYAESDVVSPQDGPVGVQLGHSRVPVALVEVGLGRRSQGLYPRFYLWLVLLRTFHLYSGMAHSVHSHSWPFFVSISHSVVTLLVVVPVADLDEVLIVGCGCVWTCIGGGLVDGCLLLVGGFDHFS